MRINGLTQQWRLKGWPERSRLISAIKELAPLQFTSRSKIQLNAPSLLSHPSSRRTPNHWHATTWIGKTMSPSSPNHPSARSSSRPWRIFRISLGLRLTGSFHRKDGFLTTSKSIISRPFRDARVKRLRDLWQRPPMPIEWSWIMACLLSNEQRSSVCRPLAPWWI